MLERDGYYMVNREFNVLKDIYSEALIPVVISDSDCSIIWKNDEFKRQNNDKIKNIGELLGCIPEKSGLYFSQDDKKIIKYNVIISKKYEFIITEQVQSENLSNVLNIPIVKEYLTYVFSKIRNTVNSVSVATDEVYATLIKSGFEGNNTTDCLNIIDGNMLELLSEIIDPELIIGLAGSNHEDKTICISEVVEKTANDAKKLLEKNIKVNTEIEPAVYARMSRTAFDIILSDMTYKCLNTEYYPESVIYQLKRGDNNTIKISVSVENGSKIVNKNYMPPSSRIYKKDIFFNYVCDYFCERYNGEFTKLCANDGCSYRIDMTAIPDSHFSISMPFGYENASSRFSPLALRLSAYCTENKRFPETSLLD